jgi:hypothetical protein
MNERIPKEVSAGVRPTYYEYVSGVDTGTLFKDKAPPPDMSYLDGSKKYAILFTFYKESWLYKTRNAIITGTIVGLTIAAATVITLVTGGTGAFVAVPLTTLVISAAVTGGIAGVIGGAAAAEATTSADWQAHLIITEYTEKYISDLGCTALPVSMLDKKFR